MLIDNDPQHKINSTSEWPRRNKMRVLDWHSHCTGLELIEKLWTRKKQFMHEDWAKIPPQYCNRWKAYYRRNLVAP